MIILGRPLLATAKAVTDWGKGEVILKVGEHTMKVDINKLMKYPSRASDDIGDIDFADNQGIDACIEEVMMIDEEARFEELPMEEPSLELKTLPSTLKYAFLHEEKAKPVIISSKPDIKQEKQLLDVFRRNEDAIGWTLADLKGLDPSLCTNHIFLEDESRLVMEAQRRLNPKVCEVVKEEILKWLNTEIIYPSLCTHRIFLEDESRLVREAQRRLNPKVWEVVKEEILKWLNTEIIYPISDSQWVSSLHIIMNKARVTVTTNEKGEEIQKNLLKKWRVYIDYQKLNSAMKKDHFPLPFIDQILDRLAGSSYFYFLYGYSGYNHIAIHPNDQEKKTFTCPFGTFTFRQMPFGLCNAPATFQRCMTAIFSDFLHDSLEVFMDNFYIFVNDFESCLAHLIKILEVCVRKRLVLSWEKSNFIVKGVVLGRIVLGKGLEVDKAKTEVI